MKLFRFMSKEEFIKYSNGIELVNEVDHSKDRDKKTNSIGFCFFNFAHYKPEEMFHNVTGITSWDICAIFETERKYVRKSWGRYSQAISKNSLQRKTIIAEEYCTTKYSNKTFKILEYAIPDWFNWDSWEWRKYGR